MPETPSEIRPTSAKRRASAPAAKATSLLFRTPFRGKCGSIHEAYISAEPDEAAPEARLSGTDEDACGSAGIEASQSKRAQATRCQRGVEVVVSRRTGRFTRSDRLRISRDFQRVSRQGRRLASRDFVVLVAVSRASASGAPGGTEPTRRLGITASRKVGNAVTRNRVKRGVREWFRRSRGRMRADTDVVVIARGEARRLTSRGIAEALDELLSLDETNERRKADVRGQ